MKIIRKLVRLKQQDYYEKHLAIINPLLPVQLTPTEIKVLGAFMSLTQYPEKHRFGTTARKDVMEILELSAGGLGNYLKSLKSKGFIVERDEILTIIPILVPESQEQEYQFKLLKEDESSED